MKTLRNRKAWILLAAALVLFAGVRCAFAQLEDIDYYKERYEFDQSKLSGWKWQAGIVLGMTIAIILAGALIAALPKTKLQQYQTWLIVCGAAVAVLTGLKDVIWAEDYQTFKWRIQRGEVILMDIRARLRCYNPNAPAEERSFRYNQVVNLSAKFDSLWMGSGSGHASPIALLNKADEIFATLIPRAEAMQSVSRNPRFMYFEGVGLSYDFTTAQEYAEANAKLAARRYLTEVMPPTENSLSSENLADFLIEKGQPGEGDFKKGPDGLYRFTASWAIDRKMLGSQIEVYASRQNVELDHSQMRKTVEDISQRPDITQRRPQPLPSPEGEDGKALATKKEILPESSSVESRIAYRMRLYEQDLDMAHQMLSADDFEKYNQAVHVWDQDTAEEALPILLELNASGSVYPIIWMRIASLYAADGDDATARAFSDAAETTMAESANAEYQKKMRAIADDLFADK